MSLIVYGDSYSEITKQKRTNGPVWSQIVAKEWDTRLISFAQSGARICPNEAHSSWLQKQVLQSDAKVGDSHIIFLGTTDIIETKESEIQYKRWIDCIKDQVVFIQNQNDQARIMIMGVPALEFSPYGRNHTELKGKITKFNVELEETIEEWKEGTSKIEFYNTYSMFSDLLGDPSLANIDNVEDAYWDVCQGQCKKEINKYLWWDTIHMTGAGHDALAKGIIQSEFFAQNSHSESIDTDLKANYTQCLSWLLLGCVLMILLYSLRHNRFIVNIKTKIQTATSKLKNKDYTLV